MSKKMYTPINYYSARSIIRLYDYLYKKGVSDAISVDDEYRCRDFLAKMCKPRSFGFVTLPYGFTWSEWKFHLSKMIYDKGLYRKLGLAFLDCIFSYSNYMACSLAIAMDFYKKGISDYLDNPIPSQFEIFNNHLYMQWGVKLKRRKEDEVMRDVIEMCYSRSHTDNDYSYPAYERGLSGQAFETYQKELWRHTRKKQYKTAKFIE